MRVVSRTVGAFQENTYLVFDDAAGVLAAIDPGAEGEMLVELVRASGARLVAIWITHAHVDHVGGIAALHREWPVPVHLHPADLPLFERAEMQAAAYGLPFDSPLAPDASFADGDILHLGSLEFRVIHVPGHAPGHVALVGEGAAFVGDCLFAGSIGRSDLPWSDPAQLKTSLDLLAALPPETVVYSGHGPTTTIGQERATNPFLTGAARIVGG